MYRYRVILVVSAFVVVNALGLSFTIVNTGSYQNSLYYRFTRQRFAWIISDPPPKHAIQAGWANETITVKGNDSSDGAGRDSVQTKVVVLNNGTTRVAIITVDLLMMPPTIAQALEKKLPLMGFAWKNVYLGATYSRPRLGSWTDDYMGKQQFGSYDQQRVNQLTEAILKAVRSAQSSTKIVEVGYNQTDLEGQKQGLTARDQTASERIHLLQLRKPTGESALLYTAPVRSISAERSSDPTGEDELLRELTQQLEKQTHSFTLAMAGSIQDPNQSNEINPQALAAQIATWLPNQPLRTDSTLIAQTTPIVQNDPHIRVSRHWRLKPWLAKALYGNYPAELKSLRIGQTVFVGYPGGVSTEMADELLALPVAEQRQLVLTSYNGGNLGKIVPDTYYYAKESPYALSQVNRFGPHTAEFFGDMTQSLVTSLK